MTDARIARHLCTVPIFVSVLFVAADVNVHNIFHDHVEFKRALEWLRGQSEHLPGSCTGCGTFSKFHARQMGKYRIARPWLDYTVAEFWHYLHCDSIMGVARPIHNESTWMVLKGTYQGVVGPALSSLGHVSTSTASTAVQQPPEGFFVAYEVKQTVHGRGIFATQFIKKGQLVYSAANQTAIFRTGHQYRIFLASVPPELACDVMNWAYIADFAKLKGENTDDEEVRIAVELDPGCFCNHGGDEMANIGCNKQIAAASNLEGGCVDNMFALKDINSGDEILCHYGQFVADSISWQDLGL